MNIIISGYTTKEVDIIVDKLLSLFIDHSIKSTEILINDKISQDILDYLVDFSKV